MNALKMNTFMYRLSIILTLGFKLGLSNANLSTLEQGLHSEKIPYTELDFHGDSSDSSDSQILGVAETLASVEISPHTERANIANVFNDVFKGSSNSSLLYFGPKVPIHDEQIYSISVPDGDVFFGCGYVNDNFKFIGQAAEFTNYGGSLRAFMDLSSMVCTIAIDGSELFTVSGLDSSQKYYPVIGVGRETSISIFQYNAVNIRGANTYPIQDTHGGAFNKIELPLGEETAKIRHFMFDHIFCVGLVKKLQFTWTQFEGNQKFTKIQNYAEGFFFDGFRIWSTAKYECISDPGSENTSALRARMEQNSEFMRMSVWLSNSGLKRRVKMPVESGFDYAIHIYGSAQDSYTVETSVASDDEPWVAEDICVEDKSCYVDEYCDLPFYYRESFSVGNCSEDDRGIDTSLDDISIKRIIIDSDSIPPTSNFFALSDTYTKIKTEPTANQSAVQMPFAGVYRGNLDHSVELFFGYFVPITEEQYNFISIPATHGSIVIGFGYLDNNSKFRGNMGEIVNPSGVPFDILVSVLEFQLKMSIEGHDHIVIDRYDSSIAYYPFIGVKGYFELSIQQYNARRVPALEVYPIFDFAFGRFDKYEIHKGTRIVKLANRILNYNFCTGVIRHRSRHFKTNVNHHLVEGIFYDGFRFWTNPNSHCGSNIENANHSLYAILKLSRDKIKLKTWKEGHDYGHSLYIPKNLGFEYMLHTYSVFSDVITLDTDIDITAPKQFERRCWDVTWCQENQQCSMPDDTSDNYALGICIDTLDLTDH